MPVWEGQEEVMVPVWEGQEEVVVPADSPFSIFRRNTVWGVDNVHVSNCVCVCVCVCVFEVKSGVALVAFVQVWSAVVRGYTLQSVQGCMKERGWAVYLHGGSSLPASCMSTGREEEVR